MSNDARRPGFTLALATRLSFGAALLSSASFAFGASPPAQPALGPGGQDYPHLAKATFVIDGWNRYWLYEPTWPSPASAPVLAFYAGMGGGGASSYTGMIEFSVFAEAYRPMFIHLARKGYIVIFPAYGTFGTPLASYESNAVAATKKALQRLQGWFHVSPELDKFAVAGHSFGSLVAMRVANDYEQLELPRPRALIGQEPALLSQIEALCTGNPAHALCTLDLPYDLSNIAPDTINVTIVGGQARASAMQATLAQWRLPQIPEQLQNLLFINDDTHGNVALVANHLSNGANPFLWLPGFEMNAIDWFGYWKPTVATLDFAFYGDNGAYVMGDGAEARDMGTWSDGTPVTPMSTASDFTWP